MGAQTIAVGPLDPASFAQNVDRLAEILHACVHEGASVGFILPFEIDEARGLLAETGLLPRTRRAPSSS